MSVQEIKEQLAVLPRNEQDEVMAYLFHLRHAHDRDYESQIERRLNDKDSAHWLSPDAFDRELDKKESP
jgi:mRNA-degrading endonuclease RelE of RelBE toxin-antitoxin system